MTATDRYVLLRVVFGPSGAKKGLRASAGALADLPLFSDKQWHCSPCESPAKSGRQKPSTRLVMTLPKRFFDDDTSEARSTSTLSAAGDRQPMASSAKICADPLDRRVASVQGVHRRRDGATSRPSRAGWPPLAEAASSPFKARESGVARYRFEVRSHVWGDLSRTRYILKLKRKQNLPVC